MNDSAYMSQPETSRRGQPKYEGSIKSSSQDCRTQAQDGFFANQAFSPTLSTASSQPFQTRPEFSHFAPSQWDAPQTFDFSISAGQDLWRQNEPQDFVPYVGQVMDPQSYTYSGQASMLPPSTYPYYNQDAAVTATEQPDAKPERPRLQRTTNSANSTSTLRDANTSTPLSAIGSDQSAASMPHPHGLVEQSQQFVQASDYYMSQAAAASTDIYDATDDAASQDDISGLEDSETTKLARTHPLYQAVPGPDDLYHCPHENDAGCTHKPTKLKCNYDKYVDSHLRPFRCKVASCANTPFSSTACLLRHEREAHGMHGHGSKPHLCFFPDCERSLPTNGFPRRYNLYDHMKRVHDFTGTTSPLEQDAPSGPLSAAPKKPTSRKRKSAATEEPVEKRQKSVSSKAAPAPPAVDPRAVIEAQRAEQRRYLQHSFEEQREAVISFLKSLSGPQDFTGYAKFKTGADTLGSIMEQAAKAEIRSG